jgi:predicted transcriptional regulator
MFVSLAARGLLREVEALCYCNEPPGKLVLQGLPMTATEIARMRGVDAGEVEKALKELLSRGLLKRDDDGFIYSPSILKEIEERDNVQQRVTRYRKNTIANVTDNVTQPVTPHVTPQSRVEKKKSRKEEEKNTHTARADAFAEFWAAYPKKLGRGAAEKAFGKLQSPSELLPVLLAAIAAQKATTQWQRDNGQFIPYPATWLNHRRWEDDIASLNITDPGRPGHHNPQRPTTEQDHATGF